jgi:hypothetical protein
MSSPVRQSDSEARLFYSLKKYVVLICGFLVIFLGVVINEWTIAQLATPDGEISGLVYRVIIFITQLVTILIGILTIYFRKRISTSQIVIFLLVALCTVTLTVVLINTFGITLLQIGKALYSPNSPRTTPLIDYRIEQTDTTRITQALDSNYSTSGWNVILISIDSMNHRQLIEALIQNKTPTIGSFIDESMFFSRAYAHSPWTNPSHMSMLTGIYPSQHGRNIPWRLMVEFNEYFDRVPTHSVITEVLAEQGYEPVAFTGTGSISAKFGLGKGFQIYNETRDADGRGDIIPTFEALSKWLTERDRLQPFFLFLHSYDFHMPRPTGKKTDELAFEHIDGFLEEVFSLLRRHEAYDESLIIFTSDHGSNMVAIDDKCCIHGAGQYEENLNVPLVIKFPLSMARGKSSVLVRHVDLFPTILDFLKLDNNSYRGPGRSLINIIQDNPVEEKVSYSYSEADGRCAIRYSLVASRYKYIYTPRGHTQNLLRDSDYFYDKTCPKTCDKLPPLEEFFNVVDDPYERHDLLKSELGTEQNETLIRFRDQMASHLNLTRQYRRTPLPRMDTSQTLDETQLEALRSLGYLE